jgi:uncharacterized protein (TIGR03067 family)
MQRLTVAGLVAIAGFALAAPRAKDAPKAAPPGLVGEWVIESSTLNGNPLTISDFYTVTYTPDGKFEMRAGGRVIQAGTYTTDPKKDPAELDSASVPERAPAAPPWPCIFKIDGESLTMCAMADGRKRPTTFEPAAGSGMIKTVFKRVKPKD